MDALRSRAALALRSGDATEWAAAIATLSHQVQSVAAASDDTLCDLHQTLTELRRVARASISAGAMLCGSLGLVTGFAGALRHLCDAACIDEAAPSPKEKEEEADRAPAVAIAEGVLWLLGWLLPAAQNAAVLHVRGDAALLIRLYRGGTSRQIRHAALVAHTLLHLGSGGSAEDAASAVQMAIEATAACEPALRARAGDQAATEDDDGATWQAVSGLCALAHLCEGRSMAHSDGDAVATPRAASATRGAAQAAFFAGGGVDCCQRLIVAVGGAPAAPRPLDALRVLQAAARALDAAMGGDDCNDAQRGDHCWNLLGGMSGVASLLARSGLLPTTYAPAALSAVLALATSGQRVRALPAAAAVVLSSLPELPEATAPSALALLRAVCYAATHTEAAAVALGRAGLLPVALRLLRTWRSDADTEPALRRALAWLVVRLARASGAPSDLRSLLAGACPATGACPAGVLQLPRLSLVVAATRPPLGAAMPYVHLTPADTPISVEVRERAWPPAAGYSVCCWVRRAPRPRHAPSSDADYDADGDGGTLAGGASAGGASAGGASAGGQFAGEDLRDACGPHGVAALLADLETTIAPRGGPHTDSEEAAEEEERLPGAGCLKGGESPQSGAARDAQQGPGAPSSAEPPFVIYHMETTDGKSYASATLRAVGDSACELRVCAGSHKRHSGTECQVGLLDDAWHHVAIVHERRRPTASSQLTVYLDGALASRSTLNYPAFDCCHTFGGRLGYQSARRPESAAAAGSPAKATGKGGASGTGVARAAQLAASAAAFDGAPTPPRAAAAAAASGVQGWHVGPCFGVEGLLSEAQVCEVCAMAFASPWVHASVGESVTDQLRGEAHMCWLQSPTAAAAQRAESPAALVADGSGTEFRLAPTKILFLLHTLSDDGGSTASRCAEPASALVASRSALPRAADGQSSRPHATHPLIRPRRLVESLAAAGGPAALLRLVDAAATKRGLLLALRTVRHFLVGQPMNAHLFAGAAPAPAPRHRPQRVLPLGGRAGASCHHQPSPVRPRDLAHRLHPKLVTSRVAPRRRCRLLWAALQPACQVRERPEPSHLRLPLRALLQAACAELG